ncbi:hypothetical protein [Tunturiibacter psychrotolerans]
MPSKSEVEEDGDQGAEERKNKSHEGAWLPTTFGIDWLELVFK